jgi:hypothetical protein
MKTNDISSIFINNSSIIIKISLQYLYNGFEKSIQTALALNGIAFLSNEMNLSTLVDVYIVFSN